MKGNNYTVTAEEYVVTINKKLEVDKIAEHSKK
jgi:hypothetical protein